MITTTDFGRDIGGVYTIGFLLIIANLFRNSLEQLRLNELRATNQELKDIQATLEQRVLERTADLERRSAYLQAAAEVGYATTSILNSEELIHQAVELILTRFDLYYVGLFLLDENKQWANLQAGTGPAGQAMLARRHRLPVAESSMIGWSIVHAQPRIAQIAAEDAIRVINPELPNTRSEVALPLRWQNQVVGALTVQSDQPNTFGESTIAVLQIMADQLAVAVETARLFDESQASLASERRAYGEMSRRDWINFIQSRGDTGYKYTKKSLQSDDSRWTPEMMAAIRSGKTTITTGQGKAALAVPLKVRDQTIGILDLHKGDNDSDWTPEETALVETLADQFGQALESARLYQDTQLRAERERLVSEITAQMRASLDMDVVLQTSAAEMRMALGLDELVIRLTQLGSETRLEGSETDASTG